MYCGDCILFFKSLIITFLHYQRTSRSSFRLQYLSYSHLIHLSVIKTYHILQQYIALQLCIVHRCSYNIQVCSHIREYSMVFGNIRMRSMCYISWHSVHIPHTLGIVHYHLQKIKLLFYHRTFNFKTYLKKLSPKFDSSSFMKLKTWFKFSMFQVATRQVLSIMLTSPNRRSYPLPYTKDRFYFLILHITHTHYKV